MAQYLYFLLFLICSATATIQTPLDTKVKPTLFSHAIKNYGLFYESKNPTQVTELKRAAAIIQEVDAQEDSESQEKNTDGLAEIDEKTFDEMRFIDSKAGAPFLETLNPATPLGLAYCIKILTTPMSNPIALRQRQKEIQFLIDHPEYHEKIEKELASLKNMQIPETEATPPSLKDSAKIIAKNVIIPLAKTLILFMFLSSNCSYSLMNFPVISSLLTSTNLLYKRDYSQKTDLTSYKKETDLKTFYLTFKTTKSFLKCDFPKIFIKKDFWIKYPILGWAPFYSLLHDAYRVQDHAFFIYSSTNNGFTTLNNWHNNHQQYKKILSLDETLLKEVFLSLLPEKDITTIKNDLNEIKSTESSNLLNPFALYATYKRQKIISTAEFQTAIKNKYHNIAYIESLCALARLKKDHGFAFAEYTETKTPHLTIIDALHPNALAKQNIPNNFSYTEDDQQKTVIISGQNGSGKSYCAKEIYNNAYLAQTTTVPCSRYASELSPFSFFKIQANVSDSDAQSKFQTEKSDLKMLVTTLARLEQHGLKSLVLSDETFSTTSAVLGEPMLASLIEMQSKTMQKSLMIYITHLHNILKLPNTKQMSIGLINNPDGTNTSTFKFQDGPCFDNDASISFAHSLPVAFKQTFLDLYKKHAEKKVDKNICQAENNQVTPGENETTQKKGLTR